MKTKVRLQAFVWLGDMIRPLTVNAAQTLVFVNVNELLGFEVGDLRTGKKLHRVEVQGFQKGPVKRHKCPSHGIAFTPDEKQIWICDSFNQQLHIFDVSTMTDTIPPRQIASIRTPRDEPGWITFSIDGKYAYPATGEVIDTATRKIVAELKDETGAEVHSEKMMEIQFRDGRPSRVGDQFGIGRASR
jgi:6-phosphogluconolactonase (cycloisomerase 2 family)